MADRRSIWTCGLRTLLAVCFSTLALAAEEPKAEVDPDHAAKMAKGLEIFKSGVRDVLVNHCVKCHGGKATESQLDLTDRPALLTGGTKGPAIVPNNSIESLLYQVVAHGKEPHMPFEEEKLPNEAIAAIAAWIDHGAPYDEPLLAAGEKTSWTEKAVSDEDRRFWSFQPLRPSPPPAVAHGEWPITPIDRFVLAPLEAAGIAPNPPADKEKLIRRAYFDLIGLPPTPDEVAAFVSDTAPDAYETLLDRLLASPHYGERWGRHWLDVARFAESHGFEHDYDRPTAYHYRDFVIRALNDDLPFDTFVTWQLAGDEVAPENNLALMATGFLAAGVHSTQITKNEVERHRYDEMDDMLATVGTSMLGLTIGCARCHDHKFDPFPQRDYYRLLSAFTTTVRSEIELNLDPAGYAAAKATFDAEHAAYVAALARFEAEELPGRLAAWEAARPAASERAEWIIPELASFSSQGGATLTPQADGSLLATGTNAQTDTYTLVAHTGLTGIKAFRLEALADPSLAKGGPGRAENGNFALTNLRVSAAPKAGDAAPVEIRLLDPRATFEQAGLPVAAAIDADPMSAWAVDPEFGKDHAAAFAVDGEVGFAEGTVLTFTLEFKNNTSHSIGRPRLSLAAGSPGELAAPGITEAVHRALDTPREARSADQTVAALAWYRTIDPEWQRLNKLAEDHLKTAPQPNLVKALVSSEGLPPLRLHSQGDDFFNETFFLNRGDPNQKQGAAPQGYLQVLMTAPEGESHWPAVPPSGARTSHRRAALARWLTDVEHGAGGQLARVIVNRLWQRHLGRGIVATPSDFGNRGERPTHPELLDWLATDLIQRGWRLKEMHKLIMSSAVYRQSAQFDETKAAVDGDNRLWWRYAPRRLEAEVVRDSLLAVGGTLDTTMYGPGTLDEASRRRSIYFTVKRSKLLPAMQVFDAPDGLSSTAERPTTTIAPQALHLLNNPNVRGAAHAFAGRIAPTPETPLTQCIDSAYLVALARRPSAAEAADSTAFVEAQIASYTSSGQANARQLALADFCQVLMCLNEFVYVD